MKSKGRRNNSKDKKIITPNSVVEKRGKKPNDKARWQRCE